MKQCIKCNEIKEITEYSLRPEGTLFNTCKECKRIYNRARHHEKSKDLQWRVQRSEVNKKYYQRKKNMSKLEQVKINLDLNEEVHNWKLVREGDGLTKTSAKVKWIEWNEDGRAKDSHDTPAVGYSLIMSPLNIYFTWQTTPITEILYAEEDGSVRFRTKNSVYTLTKINNEQQ